MADTNTNANTNDQALIREYADSNSEAAFAELVHQHIHLVHSVAFRYAGNSADAQDVTQAVFVILAKKAASLRHRTSLTGWLYETTRLTAAASVRTRARQQARDHEAYMMQSTLNENDPTNLVWRQIAPTLEEAMNRLNEKERTVLALRLFENKTAAETASALGLQTHAVHKRTARALEKLRRFFLQRGISSSTSLLAGSISANSIQAAPAAMAKSVVAAAMVHGATANSSTLILIKGALKIMAWSKARTAIITGAILLLAAGAGTAVVKEIQVHVQRDKSQAHERLGNIGPILKITPDGKVSVIRLPANAALAGPGRDRGVGFVAKIKMHGTREEVLRQLDQMHAVVISNTPDLVLAESETPPKMEMTVKFVDGKATTMTMLHKPSVSTPDGR